MSKTKVVIVACEGQHDISFITRILHTAGFKTDNRKIKDFPIPFDSLFAGIAGRMVLADRKLGYQSPNFLLPSVALELEGKIVLLHNLNGDGRSAEREKLIKHYSELVGDDDFSKDLNYEFRFLFFFDADDYGVQNRLLEMTTELKVQTTLSNGLVVTSGNYELGCYIYHENDGDTGVLEDILLGHFSGKDDVLLEHVSSFLSNHLLEDERTKELHVVGGVEERKGASKYSEKKSKVNLFGQLQFSGMNNSVIISKSDFLRMEDIENCPQCTVIRNMFY
ncbi:hypothetical protein JY490_09690 [Serratia marcescens]|uniref:DUF3226 domain-containing protein n=1 Tax=Serratia marcescens TaxID=615 RepID=UPI001867BA47|nr:DUF3226 domain-containing protein [Serratia marcescens]MBN5272335.1 hypothetical protein [Serratia marcescens]MBN5277442.1 hypothetical protein [Serratia marcescens]MBN5306126.1 hypothetical protein [Serratia marcescens]MBN5362438.1 hypothetical protein [Serratia marcescens]MBN5423407.1 hypothetical protein [Serratia marcescens]